MKTKKRVVLEEVVIISIKMTTIAMKIMTISIHQLLKHKLITIIIRIQQQLRVESSMV
jgi:hypothetical protein